MFEVDAIVTWRGGERRRRPGLKLSQTVLDCQCASSLHGLLSGEHRTVLRALWQSPALRGWLLLEELQKARLQLIEKTFLQQPEP